jgi:hypothetical protein
LWRRLDNASVHYTPTPTAYTESSRHNNVSMPHESLLLAATYESKYAFRSFWSKIASKSMQKRLDDLYLRRIPYAPPYQTLNLSLLTDKPWVGLSGLRGARTPLYVPLPLKITSPNLYALVISSSSRHTPTTTRPPPSFVPSISLNAMATSGALSKKSSTTLAGKDQSL